MKTIHYIEAGGGGGGEENIPETGKVMHKAQRSKQQGISGKLEKVR